MVYLGLGTNLGNKEQNLRMSVQKIEERIGKIVSLSAFYVTAPWGFASDNSFLNAVVCVETPLRPCLLYTSLSVQGLCNILFFKKRHSQYYFFFFFESQLMKFVGI